jgi:hypothetical protein
VEIINSGNGIYSEVGKVMRVRKEKRGSEMKRDFLNVSVMGLQWIQVSDLGD